LQSLNVSRGGTLIQDIPSQLPEAINHQQGAPRDRPSHAIKLANPSLLSSLASDERALVNSHHHQAVDKLGKDLIATAWTSDGLIEGVEDARADRFALGVQWHPELGWQHDRFSQALFERFVMAAKECMIEKAATAVEGAAVSEMEEDATNVIWTRERTSSANK